MSREVDIGGVRFTVVTPTEAEASDLVVCGYADFPSPFTDNVETTCAWCGTGIVHRPHAPSAPPKVCFGCVMDSVESTTPVSGDIVMVTGLGRCGTSLVMQMLAAGGMPCVGSYPAFEEDVSHCTSAQAFIAASADKAIKVLDPQAKHLPTGPIYRTIWLTRDPEQQARSMLKLIGQPPNRAAIRMWSSSLRKDMRLARGALHKVRASVLHLTFEGILADPARAAIQLANHVGPIGRQLNLVAMVRAVRSRDAQCLPYLMEAEMIA